MTGGNIVGTLLREDAPLAALVAAASIKLGRLPDEAALPALLVRVVSSVEQQPLKRGGFVRTIDRVSVTVRARDYREQVAVMKLVVSACAGKVGDLAGARRCSILTAGAGPDLNGPGNTFERTQDFRVSHDALQVSPKENDCVDCTED